MMTRTVELELARRLGGYPVWPDRADPLPLTRSEIAACVREAAAEMYLGAILDEEYVEYFAREVATRAAAKFIEWRPVKSDEIVRAA
jgi:hypothetical protein